MQADKLNELFEELEREGEARVRARFDVGAWANDAPADREVRAWLNQKALQRQEAALVFARDSAQSAARSARYSMFSSFAAVVAIVVIIAVWYYAR